MRGRSGWLILLAVVAAGVAWGAPARLVLDASVPVLGDPDVEIVPGSIRVDPATPTVAKTVFFHATVHNVGGNPLPSVVLGARCGPFGAVPARVSNLAAWDTPRADNLLLGGTAEVVIRWDSPSAPGLHRVVVDADPDRQLPETRRDNNAATAEFMVLGEPDLVLKSIMLPADGPREFRTPVRLTFDVENRGQSPSREVFLEAESAGRVFAAPVAPLAPGEERRVVLALPAQRRLNLSLARIDRYNIEPEPDEDNNNATAEFVLAVYRRIAAASGPYEESWSTPESWSSGEWSGAELAAEGLEPHPGLSYAPAQWKILPAGAINSASPARDPATLLDDRWTLDDYLRAGPREHPPMLTFNVSDPRLAGRFRVFLQVLVQPELGRYSAGAFFFAGPGASAPVLVAPRFHGRAPENRDVPLGIYTLRGGFECTLGSAPGQFLVAARLLFRPLVEYLDMPTLAPPGTRVSATSGRDAAGVVLYAEERGACAAIPPGGAAMMGDGPLRLRVRLSAAAGAPVRRGGLPEIVWRFAPGRGRER